MIHGAKTVPVERLQLSPSPTAEIAAMATAAQKEAGLTRADFIVIAVEPGQSDVAHAAATAAVRGADAR